MLRRVIIGFGVSGFLIAVLLGIVWGYLGAHTTMNPRNAPLLSAATEGLWPSNLMLMAWHDEGRWPNALGLLVSAFANSAIYSLVGLIVGAIIKIVSVAGRGATQRN